MENAHLDLWLKEIAPSTELRKWFHAATPDHWQEFKAVNQNSLSITGLSIFINSFNMYIHF
jgi:uncharacterized protein YeaO (DUF488 family)